VGAERDLVLVTDDEALAASLVPGLRAAGWQVTVADAVTARSTLGRTSPAVAVVDLDLPVLDGWFLLSRLARAAAPPPVVAGSREDGPGVRSRARTLGAVVFVGLPCDPAELDRAARAAILGVLAPS
jgi:two-component system nitrogen regulation response regulator GlnG